MQIPGFVERRCEVGEASYLAVEGGSGPPVLLLHGFPETHLCWRKVAPRLAADFHVTAVDLRGYGASQAPEGGPQGEGYSKREMAAELNELMGTLGHERFAVVGHDRGGRVAYRLALDCPKVVTHLALLNILPTLDQFERMGAGPSLGFWPWFLLAQPAPFPERVLSATPGATLAHIFATWAGNPNAIEAETRRAYEQALTPSTIASICADYRASFHIDRVHDQDDRVAGRRIQMRTLVIIGEDETQLSEAGEVWSPWAERLDVASIPGGHFLPEESPAAVAGALASFLARANSGTAMN